MKEISVRYKHSQRGSYTLTRTSDTIWRLRSSSLGGLLVRLPWIMRFISLEDGNSISENVLKDMEIVADKRTNKSQQFCSLEDL